MKAIWNNSIIAESERTIEVEGNRYFPAASVKDEFLKESSTTTTCPWKGEAHYYHIEANGAENKDAAWYYPEPKEKAREIKGMIAFWKGVQVQE